jgi:NAD(P)-dependent dehydrogenase (short-subunit alcohol dehydrogenase family)
MKKHFDPASLFNLKSRVAMVTGAGSGLGRQFALVLAEAGAEVALCGRRLAPLQETAALIKSNDGRSICVTMDVADEASVKLALEQIHKAAGTPDILINNAGVNRPTFATELSAEDWDAIIDTNLKGCFIVSRAVARHLIEAGRGGSIVNVASVLGLRAQKATQAYMASKAGLIHLTRGLALEWSQYGIRVNALAPGYFRTDISSEFLDSPPGQKLMSHAPQKRPGNLDELSGPLMLLATDAGSYMTGSVLIVDGGLATSSL